MEPDDLLLTIGEVSIAYVGFASLVAVLASTRGGADWAAKERIVFRAMIEVGLLTILMAFVPHALASTGLETTPLWITASALQVCASVVLVIRRFRQLNRYVGGLITEGRWFFVPASLVATALNLVNVFVWQGPGAYVAALMISLAIASGMFLTLVYRFFPLGEAEDSEATDDPKRPRDR